MTLGSNQLFSQSAIRAAKGRTSLVAKMRKRVGWHCTCEIRVRVCFEGGGGGVGGGGQMTTLLARRWEGWKLSRRRAILIATLLLAQIRHNRRRNECTISSSSRSRTPRISRISFLTTRRARERESRDHPLPRVEDRIFCHGETIRISRSCETLKLTLINALRN